MSDAERRYFWCPTCGSYSATKDPEGKADVWCGSCHSAFSFDQAMSPQERIATLRARVAELEGENAHLNAALTASEAHRKGTLAAVPEIAARLEAQRDTAHRDLAAAREENARLCALLDTPEIVDFVRAVQLEAAHQRKRWPSEHDAGKTDADWFWLIGYLAGKALHNPDGDAEKQLHRIVTVAAAAANWHAAKMGLTNMRPGIDTPPEARAALADGGKP